MLKLEKYLSEQGIIFSIIITITKFLIMIGSSQAYLSHNQHTITYCFLQFSRLRKSATDLEKTLQKKFSKDTLNLKFIIDTIN